MLKPLHEGTQIQGSPDSGAYFKYMAEFTGFTQQDAEYIRQSKPVLEKHIPEIVDKFYAHLLRYPPTRKFFLKKDGSIDTEYLELRMRHQANFWLRAADGEYDEEFARYLDYVGRAHTSHGADPRIYIAERYVIGQVGFMSHAISQALTQELRHVDEDFELCAVEAWNKLMMIVLEMLARAYGNEREAEDFDPILADDAVLDNEVQKLADEAFHLEHDKGQQVPRKSVPVAHVGDIPEGERKLVNIDGLSIGVFHHNGKYYAVRNKCLHRGGPVATGTLVGDVLTCPWHGFQYNVTDGVLLADPSACLDTYEVQIDDDHIDVLVPDMAAAAPPAEISSPAVAAEPALAAATPQPAAAAPVSAAVQVAPAATTAPDLKENEFVAGEVQPGQMKQLVLDDDQVAVYNVGGTFFATSDTCTHRGGSLSEGELNGNIVTCPLHGSQFDVTTGKVVRSPATRPIPVYKVTVENGIGRVEKNA